jgi:hypothetical protein
VSYMPPPPPNAVVSTDTQTSLFLLQAKSRTLSMLESTFTNPKRRPATLEGGPEDEVSSRVRRPSARFIEEALSDPLLGGGMRGGAGSGVGGVAAEVVGSVALRRLSTATTVEFDDVASSDAALTLDDFDLLPVADPLGGGGGGKDVTVAAAAAATTSLDSKTGLVDSRSRSLPRLDPAVMAASLEQHVIKSPSDSELPSTLSRSLTATASISYRGNALSPVDNRNLDVTGSGANLSDPDVIVLEEKSSLRSFSDALRVLDSSSRLLQQQHQSTVSRRVHSISMSEGMMSQNTNLIKLFTDSASARTSKNLHGTLNVGLGSSNSGLSSVSDTVANAMAAGHVQAVVPSTTGKRRGQSLCIDSVTAAGNVPMAALTMPVEKQPKVEVIACSENSSSISLSRTLLAETVDNSAADCSITAVTHKMASMRRPSVAKAVAKVTETVTDYVIPSALRSLSVDTSTDDSNKVTSSTDVQRVVASKSNNMAAVVVSRSAAASRTVALSLQSTLSSSSPSHVTLSTSTSYRPILPAVANDSLNVALTSVQIPTGGGQTVVGAGSVALATGSIISIVPVQVSADVTVCLVAHQSGSGSVAEVHQLASSSSTGGDAVSSSTPSMPAAAGRGGKGGGGGSKVIPILPVFQAPGSSGSKVGNRGGISIICAGPIVGTAAAETPQEERRTHMCPFAGRWCYVGCLLYMGWRVGMLG